MEQNKLVDVVRALEEVLDVERHALRNGELKGLSQLSEVKASLLRRLEKSELRAGDLERLKLRADQNQRLLAAAIKGVKAAQRRLEMIRQAVRGLNTYDRHGHARKIESSASSLERRA